MATEIELSWLSGLIDGEGSFTIRQVKFNRGRSVNWYKYRLSVVMTNQAACQRCHDITGLGTMTSKTYLTKSGKTIWEWQVHGRQAAIVCKMIHPYLIVKREQAQVLIELSGTMNVYGNNHKPSDDTIMQRSSIIERLKSLNR